jgi:hypothetical protein
VSLPDHHSEAEPGNRYLEVLPRLSVDFTGGRAPDLRPQVADPGTRETSLSTVYHGLLCAIHLPKLYLLSLKRVQVQSDQNSPMLQSNLAIVNPSLTNSVNSTLTSPDCKGMR